MWSDFVVKYKFDFLYTPPKRVQCIIFDCYHSHAVTFWLCYGTVNESVSWGLFHTFVSCRLTFVYSPIDDGWFIWVVLTHIDSTADLFDRLLQLRPSITFHSHIIRISHQLALAVIVAPMMFVAVLKRLSIYFVPTILMEWFKYILFWSPPYHRNTNKIHSVRNITQFDENLPI